MTIGDENKLTDTASFFLEPSSPRQRQYEALRALFVEGQSSEKAARAFGYSPGAFRVLCSNFRNNPQAREFFLVTSIGRPPGVRHHEPIREEIVALRKEKLLRLRHQPGVRRARPKSDHCGHSRYLA